MTTFKEYIIEKINKKEFSDVLNNNNIKAGCEFEFYLNGDEEFSEEDGSELIEQLDFPFNIDNWEVIYDVSLTSGTNGLELVTPIMSLPELIDTIEKTFKWIDDYGYTDATCGFHIHMSIKNDHELDPLKLILFAEEGLVYKHFKDRMGNFYAQGIKQGHIGAIEPFTIDTVKEFLKTSKIDRDFNTEKHLGIHLVNLKENHIEFRYTGGKDYHKKFKEIRELAANYGYWLSIACDPQYKRKEYITKLNKLVNLFNYSFLSEFINRFNVRLYDDYMYYIQNDKVKYNKAKKIADKILKPYTDKLNSLHKPVDPLKLDLFQVANIIGNAQKLFNMFKKEAGELDK